MIRWPVVRYDVCIVAGLLVVSIGASWLAMRDFRAAGARPYFYQSNFEPAVMMACGRGFGVARPTPEGLLEFLHEKRDDFDCAQMPASTIVMPLTSAAHANWYYLYGATAAVWRLTGVSWIAVDYLAAALAGATTVVLYGLFRLVSIRSVAAALALLLTLSPATLTQLMSVRDYSKAPFVLASILILALLVLRPMGRAATLGLAAMYGAVVGVGYGFRGDLAIMLPFGAVVVLLLLPGAYRTHALRNGLAMVALVCGFLLVAWPILRGLDKGGCQFHVALLGLTTPLTTELALTPPLYRFGDHLTDTFAILKVGDYASRVLHAPVPAYCDAAYDVASGQLYMKLAQTFPADFLVRAYRAVLTILRQGLEIPNLVEPSPPFASGPMPHVYVALNRVTGALAPAGPVVMLAAIVLAFSQSFRLGLALTTFVLFLTGYPAIQFEGRHWFHLRFIPWWAAAMVVGQLVQRRAQPWQWRSLGWAAGAAMALLLAPAIALVGVRAVQTRFATSLITQYESAATEEIATALEGDGGVAVQWEPQLYGEPFDSRGSDLLVATLPSSECGGTGPLSVKVRYQAASPSLDLSTELTIPRPAPGAAPTRLFLPVFSSASDTQTYQRFSGLEVVGAQATCIGSVARVVDAASWPLWLLVELTPDWRERPLYQSMRSPRLLRWLIAGGQ